MLLLLSNHINDSRIVQIIYIKFERHRNINLDRVALQRTVKEVLEVNLKIVRQKVISSETNVGYN